MKSSLHRTFLTALMLAPLVGCAISVSPSKRISELQSAILIIEQQCIPKTGTPRQDVESLFGSGTPLPKAPSKLPTKNPPPIDSPRRAYKLCENGTLVVQYDSKWNVLHANYPNPYSTKGRILGRKQTDEQLINELEPRLKQMEAILKAYKKRRLTQTRRTKI